MSRLLPIGQRIYCIGLIGLCILCFISKDFIIGRPPAPVAHNPVLAYIAAALVVLSCIAILLNMKPKEACILIAVMILVFSVGRHILNFFTDWLNGYKAMALFGGTLIITASYKTGNKWATVLLWVGSILLSVFFIAAGYAHIIFHDFVRDFIPAYIPLHGFFAWFTAVCLIAGGIGILIPPIRRWAALLSGIMVFAWFVLLHIPRFLANTNDASDRMGLFESLTLSGIFFVLSAVFARSDEQKYANNDEGLNLQTDKRQISTQKAL